MSRVIWDWAYYWLGYFAGTGGPTNDEIANMLEDLLDRMKEASLHE